MRHTAASIAPQPAQPILGLGLRVWSLEFRVLCAEGLLNEYGAGGERSGVYDPQNGQGACRPG
jgi:hypothetical protein